MFILVQSFTLLVCKIALMAIMFDIPTLNSFLYLVAEQTDLGLTF